MRVNVGLVTSSSEAAWKPSAIPFAKVVLPVPKSPRRTTSLGGASKDASSHPSAMVSSGDFVVNSRFFCASELIGDISDQYRIETHFTNRDTGTKKNKSLNRKTDGGVSPASQINGLDFCSLVRLCPCGESNSKSA